MYGKIDKVEKNIKTALQELHNINLEDIQKFYKKNVINNKNKSCLLYTSDAADE